MSIGRMCLVASALVTSAAAVRAEPAASPGLPDPAGFSLVAPIWAADVATAPGSGSTPAATTEPAEPRRPLMSLLDQVGVARPLDEAHVDVYGHIEVGYTRNFKHPPTFINGGQNFGRVFDLVDNEVVMNQLDLNFERRVDPSNRQWDVGGRVELLYGTDAEFIHASGLGQHFNQNDTPDYQFDPVQLYVDVAVPVGNGLRVRAGKFLYFYAIDPSESVFYSHGFGYNSALPLTLTGISAEYPVNEQVTTEIGISEGWDNALRNFHNAIDVFGRVSYDLSPDTGFTARAIYGRVQHPVNGLPFDEDNGDGRLGLDVVVSHRFSDNLTLVINPVLGYQPNANLSFRSDGRLNATPHDCFWYGVSATSVLKLDRYFSVGGRAEMYRDDGGFTTGYTEWLEEITLGVTITPFPDDAVGSYLKIRPEVRYDYSSSRVFDGTPFLAGQQRGIGHPQHDQFTFGVDAYFNF